MRADNVDIVQGDSAMLTCKVVSYPKAVITWQFNNITLGMNSTRDDGPRMLANGSLVIPQPIEQDEGNYTCIARNAYGTATEEVRLRISVGSLKYSSSSPNTAGIVVGVLISILVVIIVLFFVYRYRRHGATPVDVIKDVKRKTVSRFQSPGHHTILKYNVEDSGVDEDGDVYDTSDTNPFVRD